MNFSVFACEFQCYPTNGPGFSVLQPLIASLNKLPFELSVNDPSKNQGQLTSNFDSQLEQLLLQNGSDPLNFPLTIPQQLDFAFSYKGHKVAVEIEKANREKILRDLLKCHMYLSSGAEFALLFLPRNYPHKHSVWDLFDFGIERYDECLKYGFGEPQTFQRILLVGYTQCDSRNGQPLNTGTREWIRGQASRNADAI